MSLLSLLGWWEYEQNLLPKPCLLCQALPGPAKHCIMMSSLYLFYVLTKWWKGMSSGWMHFSKVKQEPVWPSFSFQNAFGRVQFLKQGLFMTLIWIITQPWKAQVLIQSSLRKHTKTPWALCLRSVCKRPQHYLAVHCQHSCNVIIAALQTT